MILAADASFHVLNNSFVEFLLWHSTNYTPCHSKGQFFCYYKTYSYGFPGQIHIISSFLDYIGLNEQWFTRKVGGGPQIWYIFLNIKVENMCHICFFSSSFTASLVWKSIVVSPFYTCVEEKDSRGIVSYLSVEILWK